MSKRIATFQISDRNPVDPSDEEEVNYSNSSGSEIDERASEQELRQRKISKPRSLSQRNFMNKKAAPAFGNLFAGLPTNPFGQASNPAADEEYDLKIRGLNKSFVESAQKLLERSPAADFTKLFQQYSKHLASFSVNLEKPSESVKMFEMPKPVDTKPVEIKPIETKPVETKPVETKPFEFAKTSETVKAFEFAKPTETPKVTETAKSFEIPKATEAPKSFEFVKPAPFELPKPAETVKTFEHLKPTETAQPAPMPFVFNPVAKPVEVAKKETEVIEVGDESSSESEAESKPTFSFGATEKTTAAPLTFSFGSTASEPVIKPFSFGGISSAANNSISATTATTTAAATSEPVAPAFKPFSFGAPATETSTAPTATATTSTTTTTAFKPFSFGSESTNNKPFSFGSTVASTETPSSATANPFSFGSSSIGGLAPLPTFSFGATPSTAAGTGFSFSAPVAAAAAAKGDQSDDNDEIPPEEAESFTLTRTNSEQLKTGAGEENETCQHEQRCKVFMMDPTGSWIDLGVGVFKINRYNNETGKSRVLCRSEGNGKVILNALVSVPGMNVSSTEGKKEVALLAVGPEGKLVKYLIRVKTLEQAGELKTAILSEIDYVKSSKN